VNIGGRSWRRTVRPVKNQVHWCTTISIPFLLSKCRASRSRVVNNNRFMTGLAIIRMNRDQLAHEQTCVACGSSQGLWVVAWHVKWRWKSMGLEISKVVKLMLLHRRDELRQWHETGRPDYQMQISLGIVAHLEWQSSDHGSCSRGMTWRRAIAVVRWDRSIRY